MAIRSVIYKGGESAISGLNVITTVTGLSSLMEDNSAAIVDIYSWAVYTSDPDNIIEFSSINYRQLLIKKASGTITIQNTRVIEDNTNLTGAATLTWSEAMSGSDIELSADIGGLNASVFRRATVNFIKA